MIGRGHYPGSGQFSYNNWSPPAQSNETANGYFLERSHSARLTLEKACELLPDEVSHHFYQLQPYAIFKRSLFVTKQPTVVPKKEETTLLVILLTKSFLPFWAPLYVDLYGV